MLIVPPPEMKQLSLFLAILLLASIARAHPAQDVAVPTAGQSSSGAPTPATVPGKLFLPEGDNLPAVVLVHGSAGPDSRGRFHRTYLIEHGYAVLELDMWDARGVRSFEQRPKSTLDTLPDVWGAWLYLSRHPRIREDRIAVMGFSWGGVNAMSVGFGKLPGQPPQELRQSRFAAIIAFYPICDVWLRNGVASKVVDTTRPTGAPVQIHNGTADDYDTSPRVCEQMRADHPGMPIELHLYAGARHGFDSDRIEPARFFDPVAKNLRGGEIVLQGDPRARDAAKAHVLAFLSRVLR